MPTKNKNVREEALDWFFSKNREEKFQLKDKYFAETPIAYSSQWDFHFTFGQIEEMYKQSLSALKE